MSDSIEADASDADFALLRDSLEQVLRDECGDRKLHAFLDGKYDLHASLWQQARALGWPAVAIAKEYDGLDLGVRGAVEICRQLGAYTAPGPLMSTLIAGEWLTHAAAGEQRKAHLPRIAAGELSVAIPVNVADDSTLQLKGGKLSGDTSILLEGMNADAALLPLAGGERWIFADLSTATRTALRPWDLTRRLAMASFQDAEVLDVFQLPASRARQLLLRNVALLIAADCVGGAWNRLERTVEYLKNRTQFGKPVGSFQALKHRVAEMAVRIKTSEQLLAHATAASSATDSGAELWAALAKADASETFTFVAGEAIRLHGGIGFTWEHDCHLYMKRARLNELLGADNRTLRDRAAKHLFTAARAGQTVMELH